MKGYQLRAIRKTGRLSQSYFGELVGVHRTTVSDWERGVSSGAVLGTMDAKMK